MAPIEKKRKRENQEEEEVAFPRGGASVLTPLEHKQIQIDATRDVLFESKSAKTAQQDGEDDTATRKRIKAKGKGKRKKSTTTEADEEESIKIEGLNYKRLVTGSLVLGQVSQINDHDIALSLPNNLTGYIPITLISDKLTERVEASAREGETDEGEDDVDLEDICRVGQYLRAYVVSTSEESASSTTGKPKRRIELSVRPQQTNSALQDVVVHSTLMASVISVEDHGLIMDLGLEDVSKRGFMSSKEIGFDISISDVQEGAVFLCMVTGLSSNGKTIKLTADPLKIGNTKKTSYLSEAPTVDIFLPGTAVELLVTEITSRGIIGKIMGMMDVTADLMHSGAGASGKDLEKKYKIGMKLKGRVICTFPTADTPKLGISLLDHVLAFNAQQAVTIGDNKDPLKILPLSTTVEEIKVKKVEADVGLFVDVGVKGVPGFVHISRVKDGRIETISETSGAYKLDSVHRGRVIGYNSVDGFYLVSLEQSILDQQYLRIEDLTIGELVKGKVEKLVVNAAGVGGVLVNLADGITGLVPAAHMSDIHLQHPEKKFKEGTTISARVLSIDTRKRQIRLTFKKSLVNSDSAKFVDYQKIEVGMQSPGTIINVLSTGAVVQFYGHVRGFLPVAEMSEAYIKDPTQHFRIGQVVNVHVLNVDPEQEKLTVSCKDPSVFGVAQQSAWRKLKVGDIVSALVTEKLDGEVQLALDGSGLRGSLPVGHLTDGSTAKNTNAMKKIRVGGTLSDLLVLEKLDKNHCVILTNKHSILKDAKKQLLLRSFEDVKEGKVVHGFVKNITLTAVFVQFGGGVTGLLPRTKIPEKSVLLPDFGMTKYQSIEAKVTLVDHEQRRFLLSMGASTIAETTVEQTPAAGEVTALAAVNPVDKSISTYGDFTIGRLTRAKVASVKETQINVLLADNIQGRIDVSQVFDVWEDVNNRKKPLESYHKNQFVDVRVLGVHDARNHRFLPISHRGSKNLVFELSAKPSDQVSDVKEPLTLDKVKVGSSWLAFVNNIGTDCLWVNLSTNVRGRIRALDVSDDVSLLEDLQSNFPIGSAIKVHVTGVDVPNNRLDLSARSAKSSEPLTLKSLSTGMIVPGKVTRSDERLVMVNLGENLAGSIYLTDLADDFSQADPSKHAKNDIVRVCITHIDLPNKKLRLSMRPSRVLSSSLPVQDPEILSASQLKVNDVVRGFVKDVSDRGLFTNLGGGVAAFTRVSDLSDSYLKDWKSAFEADQLVKGKVIRVNAEKKHVQISLKASVIEKDYVPLLTFEDMKVGQVVTGKIRKVEDFGVFIVVDNSKNVSGLCHQSQLAEKFVNNVKELYDEGDKVKAIVLKIDPETKRINFGLKASYFEDGADSEADSDDEELSGMQGVQLEDSDEAMSDEEGGVEFDDVESIGSAEGADGDSDEDMPDAEGASNGPVLDAGGFDWSANILDDADDRSDAGLNDLDADKKSKKKKRRKAEITVDRTGDLDINGPQSISDFERLLLGQPDSSELWIQYMAFQMQLSELSKAREVAERAIRTINIREETEKLNVWIALLNLENVYGSDETVEEIFKRACQYNDAQEVHERLTSIYIQSGKNDKADTLFQALVKKFSQSPNVWYNYAHFLHTTLSSPDRARALLHRATQSLPAHTHLNLTLKFAALEFHSPSGSPERGRTMFEGLLSTFPKRLDIWNQLLDLEMQQGDKDIIRGVFERVVKTKGLKPKGAKDWFRKWSEWEEANGDKKSRDKVKARAEEWVRAAAAKKEAVVDDE